jgi:integrase
MRCQTARTSARGLTAYSSFQQTAASHTADACAAMSYTVVEAGGVVGQHQVEVGHVEVRLVPVDQRDLIRGHADVARVRGRRARRMSDVRRAAPMLPASNNALNGHRTKLDLRPGLGVQQIGRRSPTWPLRPPPRQPMLVITAAYTGMRWGELTGLARANTHPDDGLIRIDPEVGALHEVGGKLMLGPQKTADSARDVHLTPFLIALITHVLDGHDHDQVFAGALGGYLRRSNFNRRTWTPAVNGQPDRNIPPVIAGMHFHDLRHTHKTWLIEDDIPEIVQAKRLGHRLPGIRLPGIRGVYSHVTPAMQHRIVQALQTRWDANRPRHLRVVDSPPQAA